MDRTELDRRLNKTKTLDQGLDQIHSAQSGPVKPRLWSNPVLDRIMNTLVKVTFSLLNKNDTCNVDLDQ